MVTFTAVNIRKFVVKASRLLELVELGTLTTQAAEFLDACVVAGLNIVVAGAPRPEGSGRLRRGVIVGNAWFRCTCRPSVL